MHKVSLIRRIIIFTYIFSHVVNNKLENLNLNHTTQPFIVTSFTTIFLGFLNQEGMNSNNMDLFTLFLLLITYPPDIITIIVSNMNLRTHFFVNIKNTMIDQHGFLTECINNKYI